MKPRIGITIGDFNGIGPEVILKSLASARVRKTISPVLIGSAEIFKFYNKKFKTKIDLKVVSTPSDNTAQGEIPVVNVYNGTEKNIQLGKTAPDAGVCAGIALERTVQFCLQKQLDAMVTGPTSKEALHYAGYNFPGQTEMLAMFSRSERVTMMLIAKTLRVGLVTIHVPIRQVAENIFLERVVEKLETVAFSLKNDFGISAPNIAVLGLNPHAGENGAIGSEEKEIIRPAIEKARTKGINASGPFAADGFFATLKPPPKADYDAVLAMYHDQGLIPLKMQGFRDGVNYSAGLKIIRTSPDHGTAYNIAGKGVADPGSMLAAIDLAQTIVTNRQKKS
ncbi:MAG: 4-hydroxythreonine-4-phosphate dehydrogenase PdxA [Bacteroidota bacterium]|nr:4-hydroxythreonine-4-phosphate dehydrogenase PdxA [Bacteroidota bacterium]